MKAFFSRINDVSLLDRSTSVPIVFLNALKSVSWRDRATIMSVSLFPEKKKKPLSLLLCSNLDWLFVDLNLHESLQLLCALFNIGQHDVTHQYSNYSDHVVWSRVRDVFWKLRCSPQDLFHNLVQQENISE